MNFPCSSGCASNCAERGRTKEPVAGTFATKNPRMNFIDPTLDAYCERNSGEEAWYLKELVAETHEKVQMPVMLSLSERSSEMLIGLDEPLLRPHDASSWSSV